MKYLFTLIAIAVLVVGCTSTKSYEKDLVACADSIMVAGAMAEGMCNSVGSAWRDAISKGDDFNVAIRVAKILQIADDSLLRDKMKSIRTMVQDLASPPSASEECHRKLVDMYGSFTELANLALSPHGSLNSFNGQINRLGAEIIKARGEVDAFRSTSD